MEALFANSVLQQHRLYQFIDGIAANGGYALGPQDDTSLGQNGNVINHAWCLFCCFCFLLWRGNKALEVLFFGCKEQVRHNKVLHGAT